MISTFAITALFALIVAVAACLRLTRRSRLRRWAWLGLAVIVLALVAGNADAQQCPNCQPKVFHQTKEPPLAIKIKVAISPGCDCFKTGICDCGPSCHCPGCACGPKCCPPRPGLSVSFRPVLIVGRMPHCRNCRR